MTANEPVSWDDYATEHAIAEHEAPQAFAAYLHKISEGRWDGFAEQIDEDPPAGQAHALS